jgi:protein-disulfide isomerase
VKLTRMLTFAALILFGTSCSKMIEKSIENNPEILYKAIKKDPAKFMEVLREAAQDAQKGEYENAKKKEDEERQKEFDSPKTYALENDRPIRGNKAAPVTIVEYSDFQCPYCKKGFETIEEVFKNYGDKVRLVFKHLPLESKHPNARRGAEYFEAIALQDPAKAFEFKKIVFTNQDKLYQSADDAEKFYKQAAKDAKADVARVASDLKSHAADIKKRIDGDTEEAGKNGIEGTPGYLINGVSLKGAYPFPEFKKIIDEWLKKKGA